MKTVEEVLRETGLTDEQIKALDPKVVSGLTTVVSTATQTLEQAELAKRAQQAQYDQEIAPALDKWANDSARLQAEVAFYKTQAEQAKAGGFIPTEPPGTAAPSPTTTPTPPRNPAGQFVAGQNPVHGSPQYITRQEGFAMVDNSTWYISEYMRLHNGAVPPDDIATIANEANMQRMPFRQYVEKKFEFQAKRDKMKADEQKKHDDAIRAEAVAEADKKWAEKIGNNPNVRIAETSRFSTLDKAVKEGARPDPLKMTREQRHVTTRQAIVKEIAEHEAETVN